MNKRPICVSAIALTVLSACGALQMPQDRREFTTHPKIVKETYSVPRSLGSVVASLQQQGNACIDRISQQRSPTSSINSAEYMVIEKLDAGRAEVTIRMRDNVTVGQPQGGFYQFAVDLRAEGARSTNVTLYHGSFRQGTLTNAVRKWTQGDDKSCHGYGRG